jgi:hypothetical protein
LNKKEVKIEEKAKEKERLVKKRRWKKVFY